MIGRANHRLVATVAAVVAAAFCSPQIGVAQTVTVNVSMTVNRIARLDITSSTTNLGTPSTADFAAGGKIAPQDGPTLTVHSNESYALAVIANTATFDFVGIGTTPNPNKPASDLTWAKVATSGTACPSTAAAYSSNAGSAVNLLTGAGAPAIGANAPTQKICFRTLWTSTATAGSYSIVMNFTLSES